MVKGSLSDLFSIRWILMSQSFGIPWPRTSSVCLGNCKRMSGSNAGWCQGDAQWCRVMQGDGESWFHLLPLPVCAGACGVSPIAMRPQSDRSHSSHHFALPRSSNTTCARNKHLGRPAVKKYKKGKYKWGSPQQSTIFPLSNKSFFRISSDQS